MQIVPGINCTDSICVASHLEKIKEMFDSVSNKENWVHIDVADGSFTDGYQTWQNFTDLQKLPIGDLKIEIHLMVNQPELLASQWCQAGIDRLIFHLETTTQIEPIRKICQSQGVDPMLAINSETKVAQALPYLKQIQSVQLLTVPPGQSGQEFNPNTISKIRELKIALPGIFIEVDGGINSQTARECLEAGADQLAVTSTIFSNEDPVAMFKELTEITL